MWCASGDPAGHLGYIQNLIASGHVAASNFYPITHIYLAQLSLVSNLDPIIWLKWVPAYSALVGMAFMYFLAKSILPDKRQVILAAVAGTALIGGWYLNLTPNHLSNLLFPLALYLLVRSFIPGTLPWKILFLVMVFLFPAFHPIPAIALLVVVWTISLPRKVFPFFGKKTTGFADSQFRFNTSVSILLLVFTITWLSSFYLWDSMVQHIHTLVTEGTPETYFSTLVTEAQYTAGYGYSVTELFFKVYGGVALYIIFALAAIPILLKKIAINGELTRLVALYGPLAVCALTIVVLYLTRMGWGPLRLLIYVAMLCTIFAGFTLFEFMRRAASHSSWRAKIAALVVAILLLAVSVNGILAVYASPYRLAPSEQATRTEIEGMDFFLHRKDAGISTLRQSIPVHRFAGFLMTPEEISKRDDVSKYRFQESPPLHFGYDEHSMLGESYDKDTYMIVNEQDRRRYMDVYPRMAELRWSTDDFTKLENDPSIDKLYANGGFDCWYVHAEASSST